MMGAGDAYSKVYNQTAAGAEAVLWGKITNRFRQEFGDHAYSSWISQLVLLGYDGSTAEIGAPTRFVRDWIERHYAGRLRDFFHAENSNISAITIRVLKPHESSDNSSNNNSAGGTSGDLSSRPFHANEASSRSQNTKPYSSTNTLNTAESAGNAASSGLDQRYTFDSFIVGKSNELAYHAAKRIGGASDVPFNPLFLHGGVGLGKTHLMHAIALELKNHHPHKRVVYISAEKFMFELIAAIRYKNTHAFKERYRNVDVFMVDDVQFIANKDSTQEEFFHTFNALIDSRCQVVITADRSPTDLEGIQERIISRLGWGLVADIHPTDYELRLGILQSKAEQAADVTVPPAVLEFLARRITSNVRELEGALNRVMAYATLVGRPITIDMIRDVLQDLIRANDRKVSIDEIQRTVADYFNLRLSEMLSERRARNIARPRQIAMYLSKRLTSRSLPEIGRHFGGRDHTTVMHAVRKVEDLCKDDSQLEDDISRLTRQLEG